MDALSLVMDAVTAGVGVGGLLLAGLANKRAKEANRAAETANNLAADGVAQAEEANRVAVEGNEIARNANAVAQRALNAQLDPIHYRWRLKVDQDGRAVLVNDSAHPADQVTVVVDRGGHVIATVETEHCAPFGQLLLDLEGTLQEEIEKARAADERTRQLNAANSGVIVIPGRHKFRLRTTVTARTEAGVPHSDVTEETLTVSKGQVKVITRD